MNKKLLVSFLLASTLLTSCTLTTINTSFDIDRYDEYLDKCYLARDFMPSLDSFTDYKDISVSLTSSDHKFGGKDTVPIGLILFVSYEEEIFDEKKEEINKKYSFVEEPIIWDDDILMPAIDIIYCEYRIRVVYDRDDAYYPNYFGMIGINDNLQTIAYLYYEEHSYDLISNVGDSIEKQEQKFISRIMEEAFVFPE